MEPYLPRPDDLLPIALTIVFGLIPFITYLYRRGRDISAVLIPETYHLLESLESHLIRGICKLFLCRKQAITPELSGVLKHLINRLSTILGPRYLHAMIRERVLSSFQRALRASDTYRHHWEETAAWLTYLVFMDEVMSFVQSSLRLNMVFLPLPNAARTIILFRRHLIANRQPVEKLILRLFRKRLFDTSTGESQLLQVLVDVYAAHAISAEPLLTDQQVHVIASRAAQAMIDAMGSLAIQENRKGLKMPRQLVAEIVLRVGMDQALYSLERFLAPSATN